MNNSFVSESVRRHTIAACNIYSEVRDVYNLNLENEFRYIDRMLGSSIYDTSDIIYTVGHRFPNVYNYFRALLRSDNNTRVDVTDPNIFKLGKKVDFINEKGSVVITNHAVSQGMFSFKPYYSIDAAKLFKVLFDYFLEGTSNDNALLTRDPLGHSDEIPLVNVMVLEMSDPVEYIQYSYPNLTLKEAKEIYSIYERIFLRDIHPIMESNLYALYSVDISRKNILMFKHDTIKDARYRLALYGNDLPIEEDASNVDFDFDRVELDNVTHKPYKKKTKILCLYNNKIYVSIKNSEAGVMLTDKAYFKVYKE